MAGKKPKHGAAAGREGENRLLDELDLRIVEELKANCRQSARELARKLKIAPSTLIARTRLLEQNKVVLRYSADLDYSKMGFEFMAIIEVRIDRGALFEVQKKIAHLPGVFAVYDVTGESDSMVVAKCKSRFDFSRLVKQILAMPHVTRTKTHVILNVISEGGVFLPESSRVSEF